MLKIGRRLAILGLMAMTMAMGGCGDDDDDGLNPATIPGAYTLRSLNDDSSAPFTVINVTGYRLDITSATITINANGTYSESTTIQETTDGSVGAPEIIPGGGTWTRSGSTISFNDTDPDAEDSSATIRSDGTLVFTESIEGETYTARFTK